MFGCLLASLMSTRQPLFDVSKTRLATLSVLLVGLANCRTVNSSHLATQFPGPALHASNYRRLQRFFQYVRLDGDVVAVPVVRILGLAGLKVLALDRTNWTLGSWDVNIPVLAIVTQRFRVPPMWSLLEHGGNSSTAQRIALMRRYLHLFDPSSIDALRADREFVGARWLEFLNECNVPFCVRLRENLQVRTEDDGMPRQFRTLVHKSPRGSRRT